MVDPTEIKNEYIVDLTVLVSEYTFSLKEIEGTEIKIKIWMHDHSFGGTDRYTYTLSHYLHTPVQIGPYQSNAIFCKTEQDALRRAITTITMHYPEAKRAGHSPSSQWLVRNEHF